MAPLPPTSLLLLSPPPWPPSFASLYAVYGRALTSVILQVAKLSNDSPRAASLQIAVPCTFLRPDSSPRHQVFDQTQQLLAALYSVISLISTKESIDIEDQGGVNPVILLLSYNGADTSIGGPQALNGDIQQGPVINLETLARSCRPWTHIFSLSTENGNKLLKDYIGLRQAVVGHDHLQPEIIEITDVNDNPSSSYEDAKDSRSVKGSQNHAAVAVGGTFDHLHAGHKLLLTMTALLVEPFRKEGARLGRSVTIGITGDDLLKSKKFVEYLESWEDRQAYVTEFLEMLLDFSPPSQERVEMERMSVPGPNGKAVHIILQPKFTIKCVEISDPLGPTITDESITALIVSAETRSGGEAVNAKRQDKGWQALEVYEVDVLDAGNELNSQGTDSTSVKESFESKISSTAIRQQKAEKARSTG